MDTDRTQSSDLRTAAPKIPKKLIITCDGTWRDSDNEPEHPTNITRIGRAIQSYDDDRHQQIVYYQAGVGTGVGIFDKLLGGATGLGLAEHIREAYSFLANNYAEHDDLVLQDSIFLIGFSRGAYTARSIGGLLGAVGLLKKPAMQYFYDIFMDWEHAGEKHYKPRFFDTYFADVDERKKYKPRDELANVPGDENIDKYMDEYRKQLVILGLSQEVKVKSIGVFETVGSLGIPVNPVLQRLLPFLPSYFREYAWFDTRIGDHVETGFQALALDEKRSPYHPAVWERPDDCNSYIKQVWFPGAHSNIGGGYVETEIANLTICWMMDHLAGHDLSPGRKFEVLDWIKFDDSYIEDYYNARVQRYNDSVKQHKAVGPFRGWSLGWISRSYRFPSSLIGKAVRTPGQYHFTSYITGRQDPNRLLRNTNEYMHASVRARVQLDGRAAEPDWDTAFPWGLNILPRLQQCWYAVTGQLKGSYWPPYAPIARGQPLHEWKLEDQKTVQSTDAGKVTWQYEGRKKIGYRELAEDRLGPYELILLEKDKNKGRIQIDNDGWVKSISRTASQNVHRASTL